MSDELTFAEFQKMCEDAGISADPTEMEQDFRVGGVMADLVDELMDDMEQDAPMKTAVDGAHLLGLALEALEEGIDEALPASDLRDRAVTLAATAVRFAAELCHDEEGNN